LELKDKIKFALMVFDRGLNYNNLEAMMNYTELASSNLQRHLSENTYPGRGLVIGRSDNKNWMLIYWIMGRSVNSRNRRFTEKAGVLRTEPVDYSKVSDPSLIIYEAMLDLPKKFILSNGDQTRTIYVTIQKGKSFQDALTEREREPDFPNFTPRISGMLDMSSKNIIVLLSILKANPIDSAFTDRYYYYPVIPQDGFGFGLTTYQGDGNPIPAFSGDPLLLPCRGTAEEILCKYWNVLNIENRVSLAVKEIIPNDKDSRILIKNQY
jgi:IMP cyclohydrolase